MASDIPSAFPQTEQCDAAAIDQPIASGMRTAPPTAAGSTGIPDDDCPCGCNRQETQQRFDTMPDEELLYDLADLFKVFADTTRIKILFALMARPMPVGELAETIGATQSAVSHQLRQLKQAHLVKFQRDGKSVIYSLSDDHVYTMLAQGMTHICE
nr:metalloregulator ArsR/SmtB family transcription factor [Senegalimassilia sp.]